jgi:hypothetical protein
LTPGLPHAPHETFFLPAFLLDTLLVRAALFLTDFVFFVVFFFTA